MFAFYLPLLCLRFSFRSRSLVLHLCLLPDVFLAFSTWGLCVPFVKYRYARSAGACGAHLVLFAFETGLEWPDGPSHLSFMFMMFISFLFFARLRIHTTCTLCIFASFHSFSHHFVPLFLGSVFVGIIRMDCISHQLSDYTLSLNNSQSQSQIWLELKHKTWLNQNLAFFYQITNPLVLHMSWNIIRYPVSDRHIPDVTPSSIGLNPFATVVDRAWLFFF
jgi:hypothetical protein